ncbi:MAG: AraC family transcriptional regulator [Pyrinomonadaceae bacterium]
MIFEFRQPRGLLSSFVDNLVYHEGYAPGHSIERFLPDGNLEVVIDLTDTPKPLYDYKTLEVIQTCSNGWISGIRTEPISIPVSKDFAMIVVTFKKGMASHFFGFPIDEIADRIVDADLIWGSGFLELRESLIDADAVENRFELVESYLLRILGTSIEPNPCVEYAVDSIVNHSPTLSLQDLYTKIGYSQKHFISMFKREVGLTPKKYLRINRFQSIIETVENHTEPKWSEISNACGFFDQSHFINDFRDFSGFTPEQYFKNKGDFLNYVPV